MNPFFAAEAELRLQPGHAAPVPRLAARRRPVCGAPPPGVPDLRAYRRAQPLTLADVNAIARRNWKSRGTRSTRRAGSRARRATRCSRARRRSGTTRGGTSGTCFRKHIVDLHYDELVAVGASRPASRATASSSRRASWRRPGLDAVRASTISSHTQNYDSAGVSIEGSIPRARPPRRGPLRRGRAQRRADGMAASPCSRRSAGLTDGWAIVEYNTHGPQASPRTLPTYAAAYQTFRDIFNFGASDVVADGVERKQRALRRTARLLAVHRVAQHAAGGRDARLPGRARRPAARRALWTFGTPRACRRRRLDRLGRGALDARPRLRHARAGRQRRVSRSISPGIRSSAAQRSSA